MVWPGIQLFDAITSVTYGTTPQALGALNNLSRLCWLHDLPKGSKLAKKKKKKNNTKKQEQNLAKGCKF